MNINIIREKISKKELQTLAKEGFGDMVKGVADIQRKVLALGGELHADSEAILLEDGSHQADLWGFNIYPDRPKAESIEFTSFINIRPSQGNRSMEIQDQNLQQQIRKIVDDLVG